MADPVLARLDRARGDRFPLLPVAVVVLIGLLAFGFGPYVLVAAVGIPLLVVILRRPQLGVLVFAALIPLNGLLIVAGLPSWFGGWKEFVVGSVFVVSLFARPEVRGRPGRGRPTWLPALVGFVLVGFVSAGMVLGTQALIGLKIDFYNVLLAIAIWRCPLSKRERDALITIFMVVAFGTAVYGIVQQSIGQATLHSWGYAYDETIRFTSGFRLRSFSTFNQPFPFAFYLMLTILLGLPQALSDLKRLRNRLFLLSLPVLGVALVFTYVRAAWLGLGLGFLYLAFHRYKWLLLTIPLALVALLFLPGGTFNKAAFQSASFHERTTLWTDKFKQIVDNPFGSGIASTGAAAAKVSDSSGSSSSSSSTNATLLQPDNSYLKTAFELGLPGLWLQLLFLVALVMWSRVVERLCEKVGRHFDARFMMSFTAQLLALMAAATVATYFEMIPMEPLFWLMVGVTACIGGEVSRGSDRATVALPGPMSRRFRALQ